MISTQRRKALVLRSELLRRVALGLLRAAIFRGVVAFIVLGSLSAYATDYYVATNGNDGAGGTNWATALLTVSQAVVRATAESDMVLLSNGVHNIASEIVITNGITLRGFWGWSNTVVRRSEAASYRLFTVSNATAVLEGLELRDGNVSGANGGAVQMFAGTIRDCNVVSNSAPGAVKGGGGLYLAGPCLVSNCLITGNAAGEYGGGVRMASAGAVVTHCVITNNTSEYFGGGVSLTAGAVQNCLILFNRVINNNPAYSGGGVYQGGGMLLNCTIVSNQTLNVTPGGGVYRSAGTATNCVIWGNWRGPYRDDLSGTTAGVGYSCAPELTAGVSGNITKDPDFVDMPGGNYRLLPGSACIDSGTNMPGLTTDLDGAVRPQDGDGDGEARCDMGAYEAEASTSGVLRCSFVGSPLVGMAPLTVVFQAFVAGADTNGLMYYWDVNGDGTNDQTGADLGTLTNVYTPGIYNVALSVSNTAGQTTQKWRSAYVTAPAPALYVATGGTHTSPFTNWAFAATNLASTLSLAGDGTTITVTNGAYDCIGLLLQYGTVLRSVNGASATTLRNPPASSDRLLDITHTQAVVEGFTLTGGNMSGESGGAVRMTGGTIRDCNVVSNNAPTPGYGGGGLYLNGSCLVSNCLITRNYGFESGGGVWMASAGAVMTHCVITNNSSFPYGGGIYLAAGTAQNCLIVSNRVTGNHPSYAGGGVRQTGGALLNCTVVGNQTLDVTPGGGVYRSAGTATNCVIWDNWRGTNRDDLSGSTAGVGYSCAPELTNGVGNITNAPLLKSGGYELGADSPCINAGTNQSWMIGAVDLAGRPRIMGGTVDIGAYEWQPPRGTSILIR